VLCAEAPAAGWLNPARARERMIDSGAAAALAIRAEETESVLAEERQDHAETRKEVRRLNTLMVKDKNDLETALITQRLEMLELRREIEAGGAESPLRRLPIGKSAAMRAILSRLPSVAAQNMPVLLVGESGVGKDLLARRIHQLSPRSACPFLAELCNIAESVMEAELFGFVRGAFTGAIADRSGIFERVSGGTIYLDEIGDLSVELQARLLRILSDGQVRPLGAESSFAVDFRLLSSTCHSLAELQNSEVLRPDFLYRINAEVIEIPPLRERREDIVLIAQAIIDEYARETGLPLPYLHVHAIERLNNHSWPGNVRELENEVHRWLAEKPVEISAEMVLPRRNESSATTNQGAPTDSIPSFKEERLRLEQELIVRALAAYAGNASQAARALQITRRYLGMLLEKHGVDLNRFKKRP
jgi:DNA-binding NtrC family response regulator